MMNTHEQLVREQESGRYVRARSIDFRACVKGPQRLGRSIPSRRGCIDVLAAVCGRAGRVFGAYG
ncbi:MAG: hypothetical protein ACLT98_18425 [Eggerthellaceae bacterium]